MAEKDIAEKVLESYNDVFSDIVNVLLFDGRPLVKEDELTDASTISQYKANDQLHEQERDVSKFWNRSNVRIALWGLENQTAIDMDMPLRMIGYDGAAYREQVLGGKKDRYPVITLVLYFGDSEWKKPLSLYDCLEISEELRPYVNDYRLNLFDIPRMSREKVAMFRSDFRIVADYFVQMAQTNDYHPSAETIRHVHEVLQMMAVLTKDNRFEIAANQQWKGEPVTMCEFLDRVEARGEARGIQLGEARMKEVQKRNALAMLKDGMQLDKVARYTGLSIQEIQELLPA